MQEHKLRSINGIVVAGGVGPTPTPDLITHVTDGFDFAGYLLTKDHGFVRATWGTSANEPRAVLLEDGYRVHDAVLVNDFAHEEGVYVGDVQPPWGIPHRTGYALDGFPGNALGRQTVGTAAAYVAALPQQWALTLGRAVLWWLEGAKSQFYEGNCIGCRVAFETLWRADRNRTENALKTVFAHVRAVDTAIPANPTSQELLVIGRHLRNAAAHHGRFDGSDTYQASTSQESIERDCDKQTGWADGHPAIKGMVSSCVSSPADWQAFAIDSVFGQQALTYFVLVVLLGLDPSTVRFERGNALAGYHRDLTWVI